jgi:hypothetical protein
LQFLHCREFFHLQSLRFCVKITGGSFYNIGFSEKAGSFP